MIVSSEPLNKDYRWQDVPLNTMLVLDRSKAPHADSDEYVWTPRMVRIVQRSQP